MTEKNPRKRKRRAILAEVYAILEVHEWLSLPALTKALDERVKFKVSSHIIASYLRGAPRIARRVIIVDRERVAVYRLELSGNA